MSATPEQIKLFNLMSNFAVDTVTGWVSNVYRKFGAKVVAGDAFAGLILPFAQDYFNTIARLIYSREDPYINEKFDEMTSIKLIGENNPIDILQLIVMLCLNIINGMDIRDVISDERGAYEHNMLAVQAHLHAIVKRHIGLSAHLIGCTEDHHHEPIGRGVNIFTFAIDKYAQTKNGVVKLSTLEL